MMESLWDRRGWRKTVETVGFRVRIANTSLKRGVNEMNTSTKLAMKFTTKVVRSVRLITSAATDDSWIRFMFAAALPWRLRLFYAHDPDYVGVGRGVCGACRGVDCGEWHVRGVVVAADGGLVGGKIHGMRVR